MIKKDFVTQESMSDKKGLCDTEEHEASAP